MWGAGFSSACSSPCHVSVQMKNDTVRSCSTTAVFKTIVVVCSKQAAVNSCGNHENMFGKPTIFEFSVDETLHAARICCYVALAGCILEPMQQAVSKKMPNSARSGASNFEKIFCDLLSALSCDVGNILPWDGFDMFASTWERILCKRIGLIASFGQHDFLKSLVYQIGFHVYQ
jgi:hypothetical protein